MNQDAESRCLTCVPCIGLWRYYLDLSLVVILMVKDERVDQLLLHLICGLCWMLWFLMKDIGSVVVALWLRKIAVYFVHLDILKLDPTPTHLI